MGTAAGTTVFNKYGWRANAGFALGLVGWMVLMLLIRGPHEGRYTWFGFSSGMRPFKIDHNVVTKAEGDLETGTATREGSIGVEKEREKTDSVHTIEDRAGASQDKEAAIA
jgi:hypothetical protein